MNLSWTSPVPTLPPDGPISGVAGVRPGHHTQSSRILSRFREYIRRGKGDACGGEEAQDHDRNAGVHGVLSLAIPYFSIR